MKHRAKPLMLEHALKPYSVLLLYPDYAQNDGTGHETYYAWVEAMNPVKAARAAQVQALRSNGRGVVNKADDFAVLLTLAGHIQGL